MAILSRDQILSASDLPCEDVNCPEWGGTVRIRTLTAGERDRFEVLIQGEKAAKEDIRAKLVVLCVVGEDGKRLFSEADIPVLTARSSLAMSRCFNVAARLSGLTTADVDELAKN